MKHSKSAGNWIAFPSCSCVCAAMLSLAAVGMSAMAGEPGKMTREVWKNIPGANLTDFTGSPRYWQKADTVTTFSGAASPTNTGDNFAARIRAYITAPVTGDYTFWISSDDSSELRLSTDASKFNRVKIAGITGWVNPQAWDAKPSQKSALIHLVAGQKYFIEALHKEATGNDHVAIAWQIPGGTRVLIPAAALESFTFDPNDIDNDELRDDWEVAHGFSLTDNGTVHPEQHPLADPDHDGYTNLQESAFGSDPMTASGEPGKMTREVWKNIPGANLTDFTGSPRYWQKADTVTTFSGAASPTNTGDNFAARIRAYITAPVTGDYTFWISSDDSSELLLSTDASKFNRVKIAGLTGWVIPQAWDAKPSQKSSLIHLVAGQKYFIESLHKEAGGNDHVAIAWQVPGGSRVLIPASALESFSFDPNDSDNDELRDDWEVAHGFSLTDNGTVHPDQHPLADPDHDGYTNYEESQYGTDPFVRGGVPGSLLLETWNNIRGNRTEDLTWSKRYTQTPDQSEFLSSAETPVNRADNFGARMRGYIIAPATGSYTFLLSGDDYCQLWLSSSESQFAKQKIASVDGWTNVRQWTKYPQQKSSAIPLVAGHKYYIEAIQKESTGGDHMEIGWKTPGSSSTAIIPGVVLESYAFDANDANGNNIPDDWDLAHGIDPTVKAATLVSDSDAIRNLLDYEFSLDPASVDHVPGQFMVERWNNIHSYSVPDLIASGRIYGKADASYLATPGELTFDGEYFGTRSRGYIKPTATGDYTFWLSARTSAQLLLSDDDQIGKYAKRLIAQMGSDLGSGHGIAWNESNLWDKYAMQKSTKIHLQAGHSYYMEILNQHGHTSGSHTSIAWALNSGPREVLPPTVVSSYSITPDDLDDDFLPDTWEIMHGLNPNDRGQIDPAREGERGDFDGDGLNNREEYLLGTDPANADTDGDGISDGDEFKALGTNALVANAITDTLLSQVALDSVTSSSSVWTMTSGGLLADSFRGEASWNFTVPSDGFWLLRLDAELMGATYVSEQLPMVVKVDGRMVARQAINFGSAKVGMLQALSPWLVAGNHQVTILVDNMIARRTVRLVSLKIYAPANAGSMLAQGNNVAANSVISRTSPAFIEGFARDLASATVNGSAVASGTGNGHWFTNLSLANVTDAQPYTVHFEQGSETTGTFTWQATNVMDRQTLTIRQGDALRLGAWGSDSSMTSSVTASSGGSWSLTGNQTFALAFANAGTFTINGTLQNGSTATLRVNVIAAPHFSADIIDVAGNCARTFTCTAASEVAFDAPDDLCRLIVTRSASNSVTVDMLPTQTQAFGIAARLFDGGPILAVQQVNVIGISDALQNDLTSLATSAIPGYKLCNTPLTVTNLPDGARIDVSIFRAGVMFTNGTTLESIHPADLTNGWVNLQFLFPLGMPGGYCHNLLVYDRHGAYIGTR